MKILLELTRTFPKFDVISLASGEKLLKFIENSCHVDLIWMQLGIENLLGHINRVGDNNDLRDVFFVASLTKSTPNSEEFCFGAGNVGHMMNRLD